MTDATDIGDREREEARASAAEAREQEAQGTPAGDAGDGGEAARQEEARTLGDTLSPEAVEKVGQQAARGEGPGIDLVMRIPVAVQAVLGQSRMPISSLMKLGPGSVVPLDQKVGEPVDVMVNGRLVARGEVVLLEEDSERFGISLTEIVGPGDRSC